jgi:hypothetical protein
MSAIQTVPSVRTIEIKALASKDNSNVAIDYLRASCDHPPTQSDAVSACHGFSQKFAALSEGAHVKVTGSYVQDNDPNHGWREIHPITAVETVP